MPRVEFPTGMWICSTDATSGSGASASLVQEQVGQWLGTLALIKVADSPVVSSRECEFIVKALEHTQLLDDYPITPPELQRIAAEHRQLLRDNSIISELTIDDEPCKCLIHTQKDSIEQRLVDLLYNIMPCSSELGGRFLSGNLTNIAIYLLTFILKTKAGLTDVQIQQECKSDGSRNVAGSKVVVKIGHGDYHVTVESTPDFYIRKQSPIVYLTMGEVESVNSRDPEMQLAIGALGMLSKRKMTKIGAVLMHRNLDCSIFLGTCTWRQDGYGRVSFKRVNRASGYRLQDPEQLELFSRTVVAVVKQLQET